MLEDNLKNDNLDERSKQLGDKLKAVRNREQQEAAKKLNSVGDDAAKGYAQAFRYTTDFVSGPIVGAIMGYAIDKAFDISPWGLLVMLLLGFAAGVLNLVKTAERENNKENKVLKDKENG